MGVFNLILLTAQKPSVKSVRSWSGGVEFDSESGQTNDFKINIHSFPAGRSALKEKCGEQAGKFTCVVWKDTYLDSPILVWWISLLQMTDNSN